MRIIPSGLAMKIMAFSVKIGLGGFPRSGAWSGAWRNTRPF
jgi:hypothetical protein